MTSVFRTSILALVMLVPCTLAAQQRERLVIGAAGVYQNFDEVYGIGDSPASDSLIVLAAADVAAEPHRPQRTAEPICAGQHRTRPVLAFQMP